MAVAVDSIDTSPVSNGAVTTLSLTSLTVGSGANRALVVFLVNDTAATSITMTWDSGGSNQAMTLIGSIQDTSVTCKILVYGLVAPTSGKKTLKASWTGASDSIFSAACFTGVDQTGGTTSFKLTTVAAASGAASQNVTSSASDYTLGAYASGTTPTSPNQTAWFSDAGNLSMGVSARSAAGAATVTYTATLPGTGAFAGLDIVAAGGGAGIPNGKNQLFPNPDGTKRSVSLLTWTDPLKLLLQSKDSFFAGPGNGPDYDWPNPSRGPIPSIELRTWLDRLKYTLQGKDAVYPGGLQDQQFPNPPITFTPRAVSLLTWSEPLKLLLQRQDAVYPGGLQDQQFPNPPIAAAPRSISLLTWAEPLKLLLQSQDAVTPGGLQDQQFPNPPLASVPRAVSLLTWLDPVKLQLAGQDAFYGLGGVPKFDWPNPRGAAPSVQAWADQLHLTLNLVIPPFSQPDWPNPRKPTPPVLDFAATLQINLQGRDQFFGLAGAPQRDWPNPRRPAPLVQDWQQPYAFALNGIPVPFVQGIWPNPSGPLAAIALRTWVDPFKGPGTDAFYGLAGAPQFDWPVPRAAVPGTSLKTWTDPLKLQMAGVDAFFGLGGSPQFSWPNPTKPAPLVQSWVDALKLELQGQDRFFGLAGNPQLSWPNPGRPTPLLQRWSDSYKLTLNGIPVPFAQSAWPNPAGPMYAIPLRTWVDAIKGQGTDSFFGLAGNPQHDWPIPGRRAPLHQAWSDQFKLTLNAIRAPFVQGSWPNPAGPVYAIALKTWIDQFKGVGHDTFFGLGGAPQFNWPLPQRPAGLPPWTMSSALRITTPPPVPPLPVITAPLSGLRTSRADRRARLAETQAAIRIAAAEAVDRESDTAPSTRVTATPPGNRTKKG